jgi:hypothetical protein
LRPSSFANFSMDLYLLRQIYPFFFKKKPLCRVMQKGKIFFVSLFELLNFLNTILLVVREFCRRGWCISRDSRRFCDASALNGFREKGKTRYNGRAAVGGCYCLRIPRKYL